jgi:hypothetical protein
MQLSGFGSEWLTVGRHRILLRCRGTFPDAHTRFVARVAAAACDHNARAARVVGVYHDDPNGFFNVLVASTEPADILLEGVLMTVLHGLFGDGGYSPEVRIVGRGDEQSDHYDHAAHLAREAGVLEGSGP